MDAHDQLGAQYCDRPSPLMPEGRPGEGPAVIIGVLVLEVIHLASAGVGELFFICVESIN